VEPPEGCESLSEHVGGLYCSTEVTCAGALLRVSCTADVAGAWSCTCTNGESVTSYDVPGVIGGPTCELVAKACANPALPAGEETCTVTQIEDAQSCSRAETCKHVVLVDGAAHVEQKSVATPTCKPCADAASWCCTCGDNAVPDYRIRASDLSNGCEFLGELCNADSPPHAGPVTCAPTFDNSLGDYGCYSGARCDQALELADGSRVTLSRIYEAACQELDDRARCTCGDEDNGRRLALGFTLPVNGLKDCHTTIDACAGVEELVVQGARNCMATDDVNFSNCRRVLDCAEPALVGGDDLTVQTFVDTTCDRQSDSTWRCTCVNLVPFMEDPVLTLEAEDAKTACGQASEACPPAVAYQ